MIFLIFKHYQSVLNGVIYSSSSYHVQVKRNTTDILTFYNCNSPELHLQIYWASQVL